MTLAELKTRLSIRSVLEHYSLKPDKNGMLCCPFHKDKNPSMRVYGETDTVYCFSGNCRTHGHSLDAVDFVMWKEGWEKLGKEGKHKAIELTKSWVNGHVAENGLVKPQHSVEIGLENRIELLTHAWACFQRNISEGALAYLKSRSLDVKNPSLRPYIGYNAGNLYRQPPFGNTQGPPKRMSMEDYREDMQRLGMITPLKGRSYRSWAKSCIIFPLRNAAGEIVSFYGRSLKQGHFYLVHRQGLFPNYPDPGAKTIILTESIIDAATLMVNQELPVLALYGTNGLTEEHRAALQNLQHLEEIIFFLDGDEAGEKATQKYSKQLSEILAEVKISQVSTPEGEDVNSLMESGKRGQESGITALIEARQVLFSPAKKKMEKHLTPDSSLLQTSNPNRLIYNGAIAKYQVLGGLRKELDSLKVTLSILAENTRSRQKLDLYEDTHIEKAAKRAGDKLGLRADLIEMDLVKLTDLLEHYRENELLNQENPERVPPMDEAQKQYATVFLTMPKLMHRLNEALGRAGVVGEERNRLFLFCCASSYKQKTPLHVLSQGASGMGKTHAQEVIAACLPAEDVIEITRMTDYSFYNYGEHELSNKVLFIEDMDSLSEEAMLALREMQSKGRITLSTTRKDEQGNLKAGRKTVYGPLATLGATTKGGLYEDNAGRCFILSVDESIEQTRRIIIYQNAVAAGEIDLKEQKEAQVLLQNCVRLLAPAQVINPFANRVNLPEEAHKLRRLNGFFNGLIAQLTWLHQYQRKRDKQGRLIAEKEDVKLAIELFLDALIWKIDELDGSLRGFYERLKSYVREEGGEKYQGYRFGQREIRLALRISRAQLQRYLRDLLELEYVYLVSQSMGKGYRYQVAWWDDAKAMRERIRTRLRAQLD